MIVELLGSALGAILSLLAAVVPAVVYVVLVWWADRYEKEPLGLLAVAFVWGSVPAVLLALVAELLFGVPLAHLQAERLASLLEASALAPVVEEIAKGLGLVGLFLLWRREFDDVLDGVVYGAVVGIAFGMTEDLFYFLSTFLESGWGEWGAVVFLRSVLFGLNHAFFTAFTGAGLGLARQARRGWRRWVLALLGLGAAIAFHALHNLGVSLTDVSLGGLLLSLASNSGGILTILVIVLLSWRQERQWILAELRDEVDGLLTAAQYTEASGYGQRLLLWRDAFRRGGWREASRQGRVHRLLTELALRKHQLGVLKDSDDVIVLADIERLRREIARASGNHFVPAPPAA